MEKFNNVNLVNCKTREVARHPKEIIRFKLDTKVYKNDIMRIKI